jgi:hypothetical protein
VTDISTLPDFSTGFANEAAYCSYLDNFGK